MIFDSSFQQESHISSICKKAYTAIRSIGLIRKYLDCTSAKKLVNALVTSHLDYCNSLLYGLPSTKLQRLQRVQNTAARVIMKIRKFDHITPTLKCLHWLPVSRRIEYKILTLTFKCLDSSNNQAPDYLSDMIVKYNPARSLRSSSKQLLTVPNTRLLGYGDRSFEMAAPVLWNDLPYALRNSNSFEIFKKDLKTYLFKKSYGDS